MQNGQGNGRNNHGLGRSQHNHGHQGIKNRDPKLNLKGKGASETSMLRSEEKERQRQEARAEREKVRSSSSFSDEKNHAIFTAVQVAPTPDRHITDILGTYPNFSKHSMTNDLIGVDHQPPTPAPEASSHHDPDNYSATSSISSARPPPHDFAGPYSHRPQSHVGNPMGVRPPKSIPSGLPHKTSHHHQKFVEEVKPSLKSGPGPGPGVRIPHSDRGSVVGSTNGSRSRPRSHERTVKDPTLQKIMSEMSDLKSPVSAIQQTPRPDHQSAFTFPTPAIPPSPKDTHAGFRLPHEPHLKSSKVSEGRGALIPPKALKPILADEVPLSEESDDEDGVGGHKVPEAIGVGGIGVRSSARQNHRASLDMVEESKNAPVSPLNNTDDSSNSDDSSATDSESSSSEEEGKQSPSPASPLAPSNAWNLETIFNQGNNNKEESLSREVASKEGKQETMSQSPHTVDEPAPPVITTVPSQNHPRIHSEAAKSKPPYSPSSDESSDEEVRPPPKVQRSVVPRTSFSRTKQNSPSKNPTIIDPKLSSSSDEDELPPRPHRVAPNTQLLLKPTRRAPPPMPTSKPPPPKKNFKKRRDVESKSMERILSDRDSDSDSDTQASRPARNRSSLRSPPPSSIPPAPSSTARTNSKKLLNGEVSSATLTPRKKSSPGTDHHSRHPVRETKQDTTSSSQAKKPAEKEKEKAKRSKEPPPQHDPHSLKKEKKEREQESKTERKKKSRHEGESERKSRGSERVTNSEPAVAPLPGSLSQRIEEPNLRLHLSPFNRRPPSSGGTKTSFLPPLQYDNGVPKLICSIPCNLIDKIPSSNSKGCIKDLKVNKEVLELRTSVSSEKGKGKEKKERTRNLKSPPNEEETKRMALCSIYRKRQSSLEPEKIKRSDGADPQGAKSPLVIPKVEEVPIKQEVKPLIKEEKFPIKEEKFPIKEEKLPIKEEKLPIKEEKSSSSKSGLDVPLKRNKSSMSPLGSVTSANSHSHSKKTKKEKRKEKDHLHSRETLETEQTSNSTRRKRAVSPEPEVAVKRSGENSRESGRSSSKGASSVGSGNVLKKQKTSHEEETVVLAHNQKENRISPHPRNSQRNASEERCGSALSNDPAHTPYQGRAKLQQQQMHITQHYYHQHVHHLTQQQLASSQDKPEEDSHLPPNAGNPTEYCSLPPEHAFSVGCRAAETRVASPLAPCCAHPLPVDPMTCGGQMYPRNVSSSPGPSMGCTSTRNQEATSTVPVYVSPFEKPMPEPLDDNTTYLNKAKELKHEADNEPHRILQTMKYLEAVLHFILTGESMECDPQSYNASFTMYNDTYKLIRHVSTPIFKGQAMIDKIANDAQSQRKSAILAILSLRCQSLLSLKIYDMQRPEIKETQRYVLEYIKTGGRQLPTAQSSSTPSATSSASVGGNTPCGNPSGSVWGGSQRSTANNSPSSLSPTPSPAGSVGSESSQTSSGYSTEEARQRGLHPGMGATPPQIAPTVSVNLDVHNNVTRHCQLTLNLSSAYDMWREADDSVFFNGVRDFFIELDRSIGPLTFQSSLRDLFKYVQKALVKLKEYDQ